MYLLAYVIKTATIPVIYNIHSLFMQWHIWPNMHAVHTLFLTVYGAVLEMEMERYH